MLMLVVAMMGSGGGVANAPGWLVTALALGFRFHPTDEELMIYYVKHKICLNPVASISYKCGQDGALGVSRLDIFCFLSQGPRSAPVAAAMLMAMGRGHTANPRLASNRPNPEPPMSTQFMTYISRSQEQFCRLCMEKEQLRREMVRLCTWPAQEGQPESQPVGQGERRSQEENWGALNLLPLNIVSELQMLLDHSPYIVPPPFHSRFISQL